MACKPVMRAVYVEGSIFKSNIEGGRAACVVGDLPQAIKLIGPIFFGVVERHRRVRESHNKGDGPCHGERTKSA